MTAPLKSRVLVLGGNGMLGHVVVRHLRERGIDVAWTSRSEAAGAIPFDALGGTDAICELLTRHGPFAWIINCIAILQCLIDEADADSVRRAKQVNGTFPHQLAAVAAPSGARIIHISTDAVFPETATRCTETTATGPSSVYSQSKLKGEVTHPALLNIRTSVVGRDPAHGRGLLEWLHRQTRGAIVPGFTDQSWVGCTALQLAELCGLLINGLFDAARAEGPTHHFCPIGPISKFELLSSLARDLPIEVVPTVSGRPTTRRLDTCYKVITTKFAGQIGRAGDVRSLLGDLQSLNKGRTPSARRAS